MLSRTSMRVPGDWSLRWPVIHACSVFSCRRNGLTLRILHTAARSCRTLTLCALLTTLL